MIIGIMKTTMEIAPTIYTVFAMVMCSTELNIFHILNPHGNYMNQSHLTDEETEIEITNYLGMTLGGSLLGGAEM